MNSKTSKVIPITFPVATTIHYTNVMSVENGCIVLDIAGMPQQASVAFSCLVAPEQGDIVMYSQHETGTFHVLSILERPTSKRMTISLPGDTTLSCGKGSLSIMSSESVSLVAAKNINCISEQVIHKSQKAVIDYKELIAKGDDLHASYTNIRVFSQLISTMAKQVIDRFKSYIRHSEVSDQVKAGQMTRDVSGLYSMDSKYTIMVSKKDTKIDGERIHMG